MTRLDCACARETGVVLVNGTTVRVPYGRPMPFENAVMPDPVLHPLLTVRRASVLPVREVKLKWRSIGWMTDDSGAWVNLQREKARHERVLKLFASWSTEARLSEARVDRQRMAWMDGWAKQRVVYGETQVPYKRPARCNVNRQAIQEEA